MNKNTISNDCIQDFYASFNNVDLIDIIKMTVFESLSRL